MAKTDDNSLGSYLKNRRARLDPAAFGIKTTRRRTPGLRREEVAQRANVSATWYTWLEQGRGGTPSADVLDGIANALALTEAEREHLFLLAQNRPPEVRYQAPEPITPALQRVLDSMPYSPALVRNTAWDVVAWNCAATKVLADYGSFPPENRNVLRLLFLNPCRRVDLGNWESHARAAVASFRAEIARTGASKEAKALIDELSQASPDFAAMWRDHDVQTSGEGAKHFHNPLVGSFTLEYSNFTVEGRPDLGLIVFTPATPQDESRVRTLVLSEEVAEI